MRKSLLVRVIKSGLYDDNFRNEKLRDKFSKSYDAMYPNLLDVRVRNRRNTRRTLNNAVGEVLNALYSCAPNVTGYGMKFGIKYDILSTDEAIITIGGEFAPYMVHLAYPIGPNGIYSKWIDWIDKAYNKLAMSPSLSENVEVSDPDIEYGEVTINVTLNDE